MVYSCERCRVIVAAVVVVGVFLVVRGVVVVVVLLVVVVVVVVLLVSVPNMYCGDVWCLLACCMRCWVLLRECSAW